MVGCASALQSAKDINFSHGDFQGRYLFSKEAQEAFSSAKEVPTSGHALFFDGNNRPSGFVDDFNHVYSPSLQSYLESMVTRLLAAYPGKKPEVKIIISDSKEFSPHATPYNELIIPLGMMANVESDDEVAALLGHELSHILLNHFSHIEDQIKHDRLIRALGDLATTLAKFNGAKFQISPTGIKAQTNAQASNALISDVAITNALIKGITDDVWHSAWQRGQEQQADFLGADLAASAGYSLKGYRNVLKKLDDYQGQKKSLNDALLQQQAQFANQIQSALSTEAQNLVKTGKTNIVGTVANTGLNFALNSAIEVFNSIKSDSAAKHDSPKERLETSRQYWSREYKREGSKPLAKDMLSTALTQKDSKAALEANDLAYQALDIINSNNFSLAEKLVDKAIKIDPISPKPQYVQALLFKAQHKPDKVLAKLENMPHWEGASMTAYKEYIADLMTAQQYSKALSLIEQAETRGWKEDFVYEKVSSAYLAKDMDKAKSAYNQCVEYIWSARKKCKESYGKVF